MALNSSERDIIEYRRWQVSRLVLRGLSQREIVAGLMELGLANLRTGKPYELGTVNADLKVLRKRWRESGIRNLDEERGRMLAELAEVKRDAWGDGDRRLVLLALKCMRELLGLDAPTKLAPTDPTGEHEYAGHSDIDLATGLVAILDAARARRGGADPGGVAE